MQKNAAAQNICALREIAYVYAHVCFAQLKRHFARIEFVDLLSIFFSTSCTVFEYKKQYSQKTEV